MGRWVVSMPKVKKVKRGFGSLSGLPGVFSDKLAQLRLSPFTTMIWLSSLQMCYRFNLIRRSEVFGDDENEQNASHFQPFILQFGIF